MCGRAESAAGAQWRHVANKTERSMRGCDVDMYQLTLATCYASAHATDKTETLLSVRLCAHDLSSTDSQFLYETVACNTS